MNFATLFSLNLSSKSSWWSPVKTKFEYYNLSYWKKNCHKLALLVFIEQLLAHIIFEWPHCYEVTLAKPSLQKNQKNKTKIKTTTKKQTNKDFRQKRLTNKLALSQREKNSCVLRLNQILSKLLTISKCLQLNCKQIQKLFAIVSLF